MRRSRPMPSATRTTSAPVASQTFAISLMNEMRVINAAFAASLIISAEATSQRTTGASMPAWSAATASPSSSRKAPTTIAVRVHEVGDRRALGGELRVRGVADVLEPALVEAVAHPLPGADRDGALHHDDAAPVDRAAARRSPSTPPRGRRRRSRSAACRRRRRRTRLRRSPRRRPCVKREPVRVARDQLVEPGLVDRYLAALESGDARGEDVTDDDGVAELGEAGARDEADVAGAEDGDACRGGAHDAGGYRLPANGG